MYSPRDDATGQAPQRAMAYMPHLAEAAGPGAAKPSAGRSQHSLEWLLFCVMSSLCHCVASMTGPNSVVQ